MLSITNYQKTENQTHNEGLPGGSVVVNPHTTQGTQADTGPGTKVPDAAG